MEKGPASDQDTQNTHRFYINHSSGSRGTCQPSDWVFIFQPHSCNCHSINILHWQEM